jgi:DNA (cytosine-5)-methyltransferase 1
MKFGSVCSGIEAASVAWGSLGLKAEWLAEIEPFPSAVLAHHYPDTPNLGDMTQLPRRILTGEIEAPEILVGGTPCQAFSVAGLREGLNDPRGQLTIKFVELADAIDHIRSKRNDPPAVIVWENVPGALSDKGNAFGCFLGALSGEDCELQPGGGKWANAGCVFGPVRTIAWRVLDAQYFGVAQRRRRVFVVASARNGFNPAQVLFEFEGMRRDFAPSREAREGAAHSTAPSPASSGSRSADLIPSIAGSLDTKCGAGKLTHQSLKNGHVIGTITARMFNSLGARDVEEGALLPVAFHSNAQADQLPSGQRDTSVTDALTCSQSAAVATAMQVRRLTPIECERLQGFPDGYTAIPLRKKPASECPDGPRYKALGNSMAVPVMRWIGQRIVQPLNQHQPNPPRAGFFSD